MKSRNAYVLSCVLILTTFGTAAEEPKRAITPEDCETVRSIPAFTPSMQVNEQGTALAYVEKFPNIAENRNDYQLYVKQFAGRTTSSAKLVLTGQAISQIQWLGDGKHLTALVNEGHHQVVEEIDSSTADRATLIAEGRDILEYAIDRAGTIAVFAMAPEQGKTTDREIPHTTEQVNEGYRVERASGVASLQNAVWDVFITERQSSGAWGRPVPLTMRSPFSSAMKNSFSPARDPGLSLSLSPNGKLLFMSYAVDEKESTSIPAAWGKSPFVHRLLQEGYFPNLSVVYDLETARITYFLPMPFIFDTPKWSANSQYILIPADSPINSAWEQEDFLSGHNRGYSSGAHVFRLEPRTGKIDEVVHDLDIWTNSVLAWNTDTDVLIHTSGDVIQRLAFQEKSWKLVAQYHIPLPDFFRFGHLVGNTASVFGDYQTPSVPPEIFKYELGQLRAQIIEKLNPSFDNLELAPTERIHWTTSLGYDITGTLFFPPHYTAGVRYPLVIQSKTSSPGEFACDYGQYHWPSFAAEPIAGAGMFYLARTTVDGFRQSDDESHFPPGYPGHIAEAAFQADVWDRAVAELANRGLIDPENVGIIGFSRSGWYTEFALLHGKTKYKAATAADNVQYSLGEYWLRKDHSTIAQWDWMYGGPPTGKTVENWLRYSISFNLDKIQTPLLMEEMGYGVQNDNRDSVPERLIPSFEVFSGLQRLGKPVEMYYYPDEEHEMDHPQARLASVTRNLDWYRFWLQGYERPNPEDAEQYKRWEHLRELRDADAKTAVRVQAVSPKTN